MAQIGIEWHRFCCIDTPSCTADIRVKMSHMLDINSNTWLFLFRLLFLVFSSWWTI